MTRLDDLVVFACVVERGSFAAAAARLGLSASNVSKRVAALEADLDLQLLRRTTRSCTLTDAGRVLYEQVSDLPARVAEAERSVRGLASTPAGRLAVVVPSWFSSSRLRDEVVPAYLLAHPQVTLELTVVDDPIGALTTEYDVLVAGKLPDAHFPDSSLMGRRLAKVPATLVAAPSYLEARGRPERPADLALHACLSHPRRDWRFVGPDGDLEVVEVHPRLTTNSNDVLRTATLSGLGVAYSLAFVFDADVAAGQVVRLLPEYAAHVELFAFHPPTRHLPAKVGAFIAALAAACQS